MSNNKIGLIVNCNPGEVKFSNSQKQLRKVTYNFQNKRGEVDENFNINTLVHIISDINACINQKQEGIVAISKVIDSKCLTLGAVFLMIKYGWTVSKI